MDDPSQPAGPYDAKRKIRERAYSLCRQQQNKDQLSRVICGQLAALPAYAAAQTVMFYVDFDDEVRTRHFFPVAWRQGKRIVVPYCVAVPPAARDTVPPAASRADRIGLFLLETFDELATGTWGILEPKLALRNREDRKVDVRQLDLIVVPGVAFDRTGGRVGHGKGCYDRLLAQVRCDATIVALAFECQLFATVPMQPLDVPMHKVITEKTVYEAWG